MVQLGAAARGRHVPGPTSPNYPPLYRRGGDRRLRSWVNYSGSRGRREDLRGGSQGTHRVVHAVGTNLRFVRLSPRPSAPATVTVIKWMLKVYFGDF